MNFNDSDSYQIFFIVSLLIFPTLYNKELQGNTSPLQSIANEENNAEHGTSYLCKCLCLVISSISFKINDKSSFAILNSFGASFPSVLENIRGET
ncbi:hypothetical protein D3C75_1032570 [compost metagenome]